MNPACLVMRMPRLMLAGLIRLYRLVVSPLLSLFAAPAYGQICRFYPSCSEYALVAVERHGVLHGGWLAIRRLLRCHPWNPGGVDHVPPVAGDRAGEHRELSDQTRAAMKTAAVDGRAQPHAHACDRHAA